MLLRVLAVDILAPLYLIEHAGLRRATEQQQTSTPLRKTSHGEYLSNKVAESPSTVAVEISAHAQSDQRDSRAIDTKTCFNTSLGLSCFSSGGLLVKIVHVFAVGGAHMHINFPHPPFFLACLAKFSRKLRSNGF